MTRLNKQHCRHNWQTYTTSYVGLSPAPVMKQWCPLCGATQEIVWRTTSATTATVSIRQVQEAHDTYQ